MDVYTEREEEEPAFWTTFRDRVREGIAAHVPQSVVVPVRPKYADVIQPAVVNSVRTLNRELDDGVLSPDMLRDSTKKRPIARFPSFPSAIIANSGRTPLLVRSRRRGHVPEHGRGDPVLLAAPRLGRMDGLRRLRLAPLSGRRAGPHGTLARCARGNRPTAGVDPQE